MNNSVARKGSLSLGNGNSNSTVKSKQQKSSEGPSDFSDDKEKLSQDKKKDKVNPEEKDKINHNIKKRLSSSEKDRVVIKSKDVKKASNDGQSQKEDNSKVPSSPSVGKKSQISSSNGNDSKQNVESKKDTKQADAVATEKTVSSQKIATPHNSTKPSTPTSNMTGKKAHKTHGDDLSGKKSQSSPSKGKLEAKQTAEIKKDATETKCVLTTEKISESKKDDSSHPKDDSNKPTATNNNSGGKKTNDQNESKIETKVEVKDKKSDKKVDNELMETEENPLSTDSKSETEGTDKKQTPEPEIFAKKDCLHSSTPAKQIDESVAKAVGQKELSKSIVENFDLITPGESKFYSLDRSTCPTSYSTITGRRSLRPMREYVFQHTSSSFRESYRKINTELDVANESNNTSLNVTVGSDSPKSWSFSFLGRSRKRDRTPSRMESSECGLNDMETSPTSPKRARFDLSGFVDILSSPVTMLRERFSRARIQTTPPKTQTGDDMSDHDVAEVVNLSSASGEEDKKAPSLEESQSEHVSAEVDIEAIKEQDKEDNKENIENNEDGESLGSATEAEEDSQVRERDGKKKTCVLM